MLRVNATRLATRLASRWLDEELEKLYQHIKPDSFWLWFQPRKRALKKVAFRTGCERLSNMAVDRAAEEFDRLMSNLPPVTAGSHSDPDNEGQRRTPAPRIG